MGKLGTRFTEQIRGLTLRQFQARTALILVFIFSSGWLAAYTGLVALERLPPKYLSLFGLSAWSMVGVYIGGAVLAGVLLNTMLRIRLSGAAT